MLRLGINGFGRIGRSVVRALYEHGFREQIQVVAINEVAQPQAMAHLLQFDSTHGRFERAVAYEENKQSAPSSSTGALFISQAPSRRLTPDTSESSPDAVAPLSPVENAQSQHLDADKIALFHATDIEQIDWSAHDVDIVLECTGVYSEKADAHKHIARGAKKVLFSQPCGQDMDFTVIFGVNHSELDAKHSVVSNGSCTTNCIVPVIKVLDEAFGVLSGTITTIHSSMHDQQVIDAYHLDLRRTRAASQSIIPVDTKLARGIERILPKFAGKFEAIAVRVPTINVTAMDLSVTLRDEVNVEQVNQVFAKAARECDSLNIIDYTEAPLVSVDFNHDPHSCIVDGTQTRVSHKQLVKTLVWCDNEWGFANRMLDTALYMHEIGYAY